MNKEWFITEKNKTVFEGTLDECAKKFVELVMKKEGREYEVWSCAYAGTAHGYAPFMSSTKDNEIALSGLAAVALDKEILGLKKNK